MVNWFLLTRAGAHDASSDATRSGTGSVFLRALEMSAAARWQLVVGEAWRVMDEAGRHRTEEAGRRADDAQHRADELRVELDRWNTATDATQERIDRLTDRAAGLERPDDGWPVRRAG